MSLLGCLVADALQAVLLVPDVFLLVELQVLSLGLCPFFLLLGPGVCPVSGASSAP